MHLRQLTYACTHICCILTSEIRPSDVWSAPVCHPKKQQVRWFRARLARDKLTRIVCWRERIPAGGARSAQAFEFISRKETAVPIRSSHAKNRRRACAGSTAHRSFALALRAIPPPNSRVGKHHCDLYNANSGINHRVAGSYSATIQGTPSEHTCGYHRHWSGPTLSSTRQRFPFHSLPMQGRCPRRT